MTYYLYYLESSHFFLNKYLFVTKTKLVYYFIHLLNEKNLLSVYYGIGTIFSARKILVNKVLVDSAHRRWTLNIKK